MSDNSREEYISKLKQIKSEWQEKKLFLESERVKTDSPGKKFELLKEIQQCDQEIERINEQIKSLQKEIELNKIQLFSEVGVDYSELKRLLAANKWREADEETAQVIFTVANREKEQDLHKEDIDNFPSTDLKTINRLWLHYSQRKFGFSVQKRIFQDLGGTNECDIKIWKAFNDRLGLTKDGESIGYDNLTFSLNAPLGHLPARFRMGKICQGRGRWESFLSRNELIIEDQQKDENERPNISTFPELIELDNSLKAGRWRTADELTKKLMISDTEYWFNLDSLEKLQLEKLLKIDELWKYYSNHKFGFSIQKKIYQNILNETRNQNNEVWIQFCNKVGWRRENEETRLRWLRYSEINFSDKAGYYGHLPARVILMDHFGHISKGSQDFFSDILILALSKKFS